MGVNMESRRIKALLVDGYNLIYAHPALSGLLKSDLGAAREGLLRELAPLASPDAYDLVMVVFDAARYGGAETAWEEREGLTVVFTRRRQTADSFIEAAARRMVTAGEVVVATSDRLLRGVVEGFGAKGLDGGSLFFLASEERERMREEMKRVAGPGRRPLEERVSEEIRELLDRMRYG